MTPEERIEDGLRQLGRDIKIPDDNWQEHVFAEIERRRKRCAVVVTLIVVLILIGLTTFTILGLLS